MVSFRDFPAFVFLGRKACWDCVRVLKQFWSQAEWYIQWICYKLNPRPDAQSVLPDHRTPPVSENNKIWSHQANCLPPSKIRIAAMRTESLQSANIYCHTYMIYLLFFIFASYFVVTLQIHTKALIQASLSPKFDNCFYCIQISKM